MTKNTKTSLVFGSIVVLAAILSVWGFSKSQNDHEEVLGEISKEQPKIMIFSGKGCPHCKDLEEFIAKNNLADKIDMESLEVWYNKENAKIFSAKAKECSIPQDKLGVPFLYSEGKCFSGTPDIEKFLMEKAGLK